MNFDNYPDHQWIINSDRLVFNSKKDNIFLLAAKDLAISTQGDIHLNTKGKLIVNADSIQLGIDNKNIEPIAKGQSTFDIFNRLLNSLSELSQSLSTATGQGVGVINLVMVNAAASKLNSDIQQVKKDLKNILSTKTFSN